MNEKIPLYLTNSITSKWIFEQLHLNYKNLFNLGLPLNRFILEACIVVSLGKVNECPKNFDLENIFKNFLWEKKKSN